MALHVRLRSGTLTMVYKLSKETEKTWKKLKGYTQINQQIKGIVRGE